MKKILFAGVILLILIGVGGYAWRNPLPNDKPTNESNLETIVEPPIYNSEEKNDIAVKVLNNLTVEIYKDDISMKVIDPLENEVSDENMAIDNVTFGFEPSMTPDEPGAWMYEHNDPINGIYMIYAYGKPGEKFEMWIHSMDQNGQRFTSKKNHTLNGDGEIMLELDNNSEDYTKTTLKLVE